MSSDSVSYFSENSELVESLIVWNFPLSGITGMGLATADDVVLPFGRNDPGRVSFDP